MRQMLALMVVLGTAQLLLEIALHSVVLYKALPKQLSSFVALISILVCF